MWFRMVLAIVLFHVMNNVLSCYKDALMPLFCCFWYVIVSLLSGIYFDPLL